MYSNNICKISNFSNVNQRDYFDALTYVMENSCDGMAIFDGKGKFLYVNSTYQKLSGFNSTEIEGSLMKDMAKDRLYKERKYPSAIEQRQIVHHTKVFSKTGLEVFVTCKPIYNEDDKIIFVISNTNNIKEFISMPNVTDINKKLSKTCEKAILHLEDSRFFDDNIISKSVKMNETISKVLKASTHDVDILLEGETGTGKSMLAKLIYKNSPRFRSGKFIEVNCAAIPNSLIESEFFGYEKGSFTGANNNGKTGLFEEADKGIIFLDEIDGLPIDMQTRLLYVLQERIIRRVGSTNCKKVDFQVIAASNKPLNTLIEKDKFRKDLYYRLNVIPITIPSLRERQDDILPLSNHYLNIYNKTFKTSKAFSDDVLDVFINYDWPGNVRELANLVKSIVIMSNYNCIELYDLPENMQNIKIKDKAKDKSGLNISLNTLISDLETELIEKALKENGSIRKAAEVLNITPSSLYRRMVKHGYAIPK